MARTNKPYSRSDSTYRKGNPNGSAWTHDLHDKITTPSTSSTLASRLAGNKSSSSYSSSGPSSSGGNRPNLLSRISGGKGKELIPSGSSSASGVGVGTKLHGYDNPIPTNPATNVNAGIELFPTSKAPGGSGGGVGPVRNKGTGGARVFDSRIVASGMKDAGLGGGSQRFREVKPVGFQSSIQQGNLGRGKEGGVSIFGAAKSTIWVRVENLAQGTTAEDVMSAFSSSPISSAIPTPNHTGPLVSIDLEFTSRQPAEELIGQYNGIVADGNTLKLSIVKQGLGERMGLGPGAGSGGKGSTIGGGRGEKKELFVPPSSGKLYSDTILASNPSTAIITLADESTSSRHATKSRADIWPRSSNSGSTQRSSLASRVGNGNGNSHGNGNGNGNRRGRGQIGGGSYADMMVD